VVWIIDEFVVLARYRRKYAVRLLLEHPVAAKGVHERRRLYDPCIAHRLRIHPGAMNLDRVRRQRRAPEDLTPVGIVLATRCGAWREGVFSASLW
jgi:hypothetical protein